MTRVTALLVAAMLLFTACGDDSGPSRQTLGSGDSGGSEDSNESGNDGGSKTAGIDVCTLLTDEELSAVLGAAPAAEAGEPAGPFTNCSWGVGRVLVSIATTDTLILAPGEDECPSAGIGDESYSCPGRVKFLVNGIHVSVSTIEDVTNDQLLALARTIPSKLPA